MYKKYSNILFDLDGTLTDPYEGISKSIQHALSKFNIVETDETRLRSMIGPPLLHSLMKYYNFSEEESKKLIPYYREYFVEKGIYENKIYDGIEDLLKDLKAAGKVIGLATSKPEFFAKQILEYFRIVTYFSSISGSTMNGNIVEKTEIVSLALRDINAETLNRTVMVGDRKYDIEGAKANSIDSIGVLYGFGSLAELKEANATYIVKNINELREILLV